jgi:threonine/homoserine/homoserine lactone efflux protein
LALLAATGKGGVRGGLAATLGVIAGDQVLLWLAVAGLSALLLSYPSFYGSLKWAGAAYLIGLGYSLFNAKPGSAPVLEMKSDRFFRQGLLITVLNPKAVVFYMAFFPLFVDPKIHQGLITFAVMAATIAALTMAYGLVLVLLAHHLSERVRSSPLATAILNKIAGALLIGFGLKLVLF